MLPKGPGRQQINPSEKWASEVAAAFTRTLDKILLSIFDEGRRVRSDSRTPLQVGIFYCVFAVLTWLLGSTAGALIFLLLSVFAFIMYLEQRALADGISASLDEAIRAMASNGFEVDYGELAPRILRSAIETQARQIHSLLPTGAPGDTPSGGGKNGSGAMVDANPDLSAQQAAIAFSAVLVDGARAFRLHSIFNVGLILAQRPGARALGTVQQWKKLGRVVAADAIPIVILWPFRPVTFLYEVEDTLPPYDRHLIGDPFGVTGAFNSDCISKLEESLTRQKSFIITVKRSRTGYRRAGSAAYEGRTPMQGELRFSERAAQSEYLGGSLPAWRITLNDRMSPAEQFVSLCHELGHIFCGHLGGCNWHHERELSGWPDRRALSGAAQEIEAETVAWMLAERAGLETRCKKYIEHHATNVDPAELNRDVVILAANRIEKLAGIQFRDNDAGLAT